MNSFVRELKNLPNRDLVVLAKFLNVSTSNLNGLPVLLARKLYRRGAMDVSSDTDSEYSYYSETDISDNDGDYSDDAMDADIKSVDMTTSIHVQPYILIWNIAPATFAKMVVMYNTLCKGLLEPIFVMGKDTWRGITGETIPEQEDNYRIQVDPKTKAYCLVAQDPTGEGIGCKRFFIQEHARHVNQPLLLQIDGNVGPIARTTETDLKRALSANVPLTLHTYREVVEHLMNSNLRCSSNDEERVGMFGVTKTFQGSSLSDTCNHTIYKFYMQDLTVIPPTVVYNKKLMHFGEDIDYILKMKSAGIATVKLGTYITTDLRDRTTYLRWKNSANTPFADLRVKEIVTVTDSLLKQFPQQVIRSDGGLPPSSPICSWPVIPDINAYRPVYDHVRTNPIDSGVYTIEPSNPNVSKWWKSNYNMFAVQQIPDIDKVKLRPFDYGRPTGSDVIPPPRIILAGKLRINNILVFKTDGKFSSEFLTGNATFNQTQKYAECWFRTFLYFAIEDWLTANNGRYTADVWEVFEPLFGGKHVCYNVPALKSRFPGALRGSARALR